MATVQDGGRTTEGGDVRDGRAGDRESGLRRRIMMVVGGIVIVAGLIWGGFKLGYMMNHVSTDDATVEGHILPVLSKVGGFVKTVSVSDNDHVAEGRMLVVIDDAEYRARLAQAQANLAVAEAGAGGGARQGGEASAQLSAASSQQAAMQAQIQAAQAAANRAQRDYERLQSLAGQNIVSRQQLDAAQTAAETAKAELQALQRRAAAAGASVTGAAAGVRAADARLKAAQAQLEEAQLNLSYTQIRAPVTGIVSKKSVEPGQLVQPGQPLMAIVADTGMWVTANLKETDLGHVKAGQPVEFDVDAYGGCAAQGVVESISPATGATFALLPPDNATGNFTKVVQRVPVRVRVTRGCGPDHPLRPGLSVEVHIRTG